MRRQFIIALAAGGLFGAGLILSGMIDPARVRGFLSIGAIWNPALLFVMAGALFPMAVAWRLQKRLLRPLQASSFDLPATRGITARLLAGAGLFGIGWGITGLCPGPALAALALSPLKVLPFFAAMLVGMAIERLSMTTRPGR